MIALEASQVNRGHILTRRQLADIYEALTEAREFLDGQIDVVDGSYGEPAPNRAMTICRLLDEATAIIPDLSGYRIGEE